MQQGREQALTREAVAFDHHSAEHARNWPAEFADLREKNPRAWSEAHGGYWVVTRLQDIVGIGQRPDIFSADKGDHPVTGDWLGGASIPPVPEYRAIPNESASPEWDGIRTFINRRLAPKAVEGYRLRAKQFAAALVDDFIEKGTFDIVEDFTNPMPALVTMELFGFPLHDWRAFADPVHKIIYTRRDEPAYPDALRGLEYFVQRVDEEVELRRKDPRDDLLTHLAIGTIGGEPLARDKIQSLALNLLVGGVDTTTSLTSHSLVYLAQNPADRERLRLDRALINLAREEFVRYFSPIHGQARTVVDDTDVDGWKFARGDRVYLAYASANRDPAAFDDPERIILDRMPNRHIAFGAGMHRCVGSFLARMMFETMLNEILDRLPDYRVDLDRAQLYPTIATVNGWISIPATFTPGARVGATIS